MSELKQLTIDTLKPFPLPTYLNVLPEPVLREFSGSYDLVAGYIKSLAPYQAHHQAVVAELGAQVQKLNECSELLVQYNQASKTITGQIRILNGIYDEWTNLEMIQYQLLSSNFNQDALKRKFEKLLAESDARSNNEIRRFRALPSGGQSESEFSELIENFRRERKVYHGRKEKLNRWNEERVTGFV